MTTESLLQLLHQTVGEAHVLTGTGLERYERDWQQRVHGKALAVVRPASTAEVAAVLAACAQAQVAVVPQGGNTGLVAGGVPDASGTQVVLSLQRMQAVRAIDAHNMTMTVEAGCTLQQVQQAAAQAGLLFPLSLGSEGSCTIGGNLATNAGGTQVVRYGNARELCLGLEVVTAQGQVWEGLSGLRKDNTGYDLRDLFIGSEGTLGVITAATLRLYPQPVAQLTAWVALPDLQQASALLQLARQQLDAGLSGFEVMNQFALSLVAKHLPQLRPPMWQSQPWCVLLELSDSESEQHARARFEQLLEAALEQGLISDAIVAASLQQAQELWHVREGITLAQAQEGQNLKHDVSIAISAIPQFVQQANAALLKAWPDVRILTYGHLGDGNLHYNVQHPQGQTPAQFNARHGQAISETVYALVRRFGGSISAEHGIGALKRDTLPQYKSPVALQLMQAIKQALDPQALMNPGKVLAWPTASQGGQSAPSGAE
ncbi:hydroxyacid dehydrogenase [Vandammella animalimorsus]|uniref:Hydroxyacid dehydrogenase n=1 Tax=Vandammella animalimorsus TaxID=2029117 RepID=A0A2A2T1N5_9BURK|nr:FAD-binding oxidoreductase [Vandammella animalimorsus]PAT30961.1 hydroxyacid dehydrogenase [Vandammella animalimorsus]PAX15357.1 hydroxyacid dehydrogenase [Vandammella animalimorsus]PAX16754.1 hydroxyacid dehydrogenase [Vandammella animalimorsus]